MTIRVAENLLWLVPGMVGGSEEYTLGLLRALSDAKPEDIDVELFGQPSLFTAHPDLPSRFCCHQPPSRLPAITRKPIRFAVESSWLAGRTRTFDVVHHGGGVMPFRPIPPAGTAGGRRIVTVHDLQPLDLPDNFSRSQQMWFRAMLPRVARTADRVLCPSQFSSDRVRDRLGVEEDRLDVVPPVHRLPVPLPAPGASITGAHDPYLLYPAMAHPHKRHVDAVEALAHLIGHHPRLRLVFTGAPAGASDSIVARIAALDLADRVEIRGRVSADELEALLAGAEVLVFPSAYEGFGNPVVEAMSRRVPVVAASSTAAGEVAGDAALLVPPSDPAAMASAVNRILTDPALAERLRTDGYRRAADFSAERAVAALCRSFRQALADESR